MKLLMQPLTSIHVRTEALMLTKVEVWWYMVVQLGPNLSPNFDQVRHSHTKDTFLIFRTVFRQEVNFQKIEVVYKCV